MDLTTTKQIKRRVINILPDPTKETTDCSIKVSNWFQNVQLHDKKFKVASFYLNNTALPCFIPRWPSASPPVGWQGVGTIIVTTNTALDQNALDYQFNISDTINHYGSTVVMDPTFSQYPSRQPPNHPSIEFQELSNKYYWFFNTTQFIEMLGKQINLVINTNSLSQYGVAFTRTTQGYGLYVPTTLVEEVQFSQTLIDLFQFKNKVSTNSTYLRTIEFNAQLRNYFVEDLTSPGTFVSKPCYFVASNYIPDKWFPFDQLLIRTDLPLEPEIVFDNNNFISQTYQNIILTFKLSNNNPDGIYNFYTSEIDPHSGWCSLVGTNSNDNCTFDILLRLRRTKDILPFQIKNDESAYFLLETITTE